ncbi:MAG: hypothetical protein ACE5D8_02615 [Fidelibacterota bacterium]
MGGLKHYSALLLLFCAFPLTAQDTITKYYAAGENPAAIFGKEITPDDTSHVPYFKVMFSETGDILSIQYLEPAPAISSDTTQSAVSDIVRQPVFIPMTPEQQAALNPRNAIVQNAWHWQRSKFKVSRSEPSDESKTDSLAMAGLDSTTADTTEQDSILQPPQEVIAIFKVDAPELESDSIHIKERKEQRIVKSRKERIGYYKKWNVLKNIFADPLTHRTAISNYYEAHFDKSGTLDHVVQYRIRGKPVKTFTFQRDSTGLYHRYTVTYHVRGSILSENPHQYAYPASELRPGWQARFRMDPAQKRIEAVAVRDQNGIPMYRYEFDYRRGRDLGRPEFRGVTISKYFTQSDSLVGFHYLWYGDDRELARIEYFAPDSTLKRIKELYFIPERKELLITLRNSEGKIIDRRLKPIY